MTKKKWKNAAEKQREYRLRHGQKRKVPIPMRRGEKLGTSEGQIRERNEGETWEEYQRYIKLRILRAWIATAKDPHKPITDEEGESKRARRAVGGYKEPEMGEDYYERRREHEEVLVKATKRRRVTRRK